MQKDLIGGSSTRTQYNWNLDDISQEKKEPSFHIGIYSFLYLHIGLILVFDASDSEEILVVQNCVDLSKMFRFCLPFVVFNIINILYRCL